MLSAGFPLAFGAGAGGSLSLMRAPPVSLPLLAVFLCLQRLAPCASPELAAAVDKLRDEIEVAAQYGATWPEAEALLGIAGATDDGDLAGLDRACVDAAAELARRRTRPELWRPLPARSLADVRIEQGRLVRYWWTPQGVQGANVWLGATRNGEVLPGATAILRDVFTEEDARDARRMNRVVLPRFHDAPPRGLWFADVATTDTSIQSTFRTAISLTAFQRYAPVLEGEDLVLTGMGDPVQALVEGGAALECQPRGVFSIAGGTPRFGLVFLYGVPARPPGEMSSAEHEFTGGTPVPPYRRVSGLTLQIQGESTLTIRDPVHPERELRGEVELPGLILFEFPR